MPNTKEVEQMKEQILQILENRLIGYERIKTLIVEDILALSNPLEQSEKKE